MLKFAFDMAPDNVGGSQVLKTEGEVVSKAGIEVGEMSDEQFQQYVDTLPPVKLEELSNVLQRLIDNMVAKM